MVSSDADTEVKHRFYVSRTRSMCDMNRFSSTFWSCPWERVDEILSFAEKGFYAHWGWFLALFVWNLLRQALPDWLNWHHLRRCIPPEPLEVFFFFFFSNALALHEKKAFSTYAVALTKTHKQTLICKICGVTLKACLLSSPQSFLSAHFHLD